MLIIEKNNDKETHIPYLNSDGLLYFIHYGEKIILSRSDTNTLSDSLLRGYFDKDDIAYIERCFGLCW